MKLRPACIALLLASVLPTRGDVGPLGWFSAELRETRRGLRETRGELEAMGEPIVGQTVPQLGYQHPQLAAPPPESPWVQLDLGAPQRLDTIALVPALVDFQPVARAAYGFPRRFRVDASDDPAFASFTPLLVHTDEDFQPRGVAPVVIAAGGITARYLRVTVTRLAEESGVFFFALGEVMALQGARNIALGAKVTASSAALQPPRWHPDYLVDGRTPLGPPIVRSELPEFDAFFASEPPSGGHAWMGVDLGREVVVEEVRLHPLHARQGADVPGYAFPLQFRVELAAGEDFADARVIFETGPESDFPNPGNNPVTLSAGGARGRFVRVVMLKRFRADYPSMALAELEVYSGDENVARGARVLSSGDPARRPQRPGTLLTDGLASYGRLGELPVWLEQWARRARLRTALATLEARLPSLEQVAQRRAAWTAGAVAAGLAVLGAVLAVRARRRRAAELELFRARLAQDLHDEIGSNLAGIARLSEAAAASADATAEDWREVLQVARESTDAMREVLWLVGARSEQGIALAEHLPLVAARLLAGKEVRWLTPPAAPPAEWGAQDRRELFLFFKEALANVARHAQASCVELSARVVEGAFELVIGDDGCGFVEAETPPGMGLRGLRERARSLRGTVTIDSAPGRGTRIVLRVPLAEA